MTWDEGSFKSQVKFALVGHSILEPDLRCQIPPQVSRNFLALCPYWFGFTGKICSFTPRITRPLKRTLPPEQKSGDRVTRDNYAPWIGKRSAAVGAAMKRSTKRADAGGKYAPWMGKRKRAAGAAPAAGGKYAPWMGKRADSGYAPWTSRRSAGKGRKGLLAVARYGKRESRDGNDGDGSQGGGLEAEADALQLQLNLLDALRIT